MEQRNFLFVMVFILLVGGSWWLAEVSTNGGSDRQPEDHTSDYFLENFTTTTMGPDGKPYRRLRAARMVHYPDDDSTELTRPHMTLYEEGRPLWQISSETGWLSGDGDLLLLQGKVTIDRLAAPGIRPLNIVTRNLRVQPQENYVETDEKIIVRSLNNRLVSTGMRAWLTKPMRIKFISNVRGRYEVN